MTTRSFYVPWALPAALCFATACGGAATKAPDELSTPVVQITPADLEHAVTYRLSPDRSAVLTSRNPSDESSSSAPANLVMRVNSGAVVWDTTLTIARVREERTPRGVVGYAYLLSPEVTTLSAPARLVIRVSDLPNGTSFDHLRLARLDTGEANYQPVAGQAAVNESGMRVLGGEITSFGVYAVVDTAKVAIRGDVAPTAYWRGMHLLDAGQINAAKAAFEQAYAEEAGQSGGPSRESSFALGLLRLLTLPGLSSLQDFLGACGQPPWDPSALFGDSGYFAQDQRRGQGLFDLDLSTGFDDVNLLTRPLVPTRILAEIASEPICADRANNLTLAAGALTLRVTDPNIDGDGTTLTVRLDVDADSPRHDSGSSLAALAAESPDGIVEIPLAQLNGYLEARRAGSGDQDQGDGDLGYGETDEIGVFRPRASAPGTLRIRYAGSEIGDEVEVGFAGVALEPQWQVDRPELLRLDGWVRGTISTPPTLERIPLLGDDDLRIEDFLASCSSTTIPMLDEAFLLGLAGDVLDELEQIAVIFTQAVAGDEGRSFRFDVSLGLLQQPGVLSLGPAEVHLMAGFLYTAVAAGRILTSYRYVGSGLDLRSAIIDGTRDADSVCADPCNPDSCTPAEATTGKVFSAPVLAVALNANLLTRDSEAGDLRAAQQLLLAAIEEITAALTSSAFGTPLNFQTDAALPGTGAMLTFLAELRAALLASDLQDGARVGLPADEGEVAAMFLFLDGLFASPPDISVLRERADQDAGALPVFVTASVQLTCDGWSYFYDDLVCNDPSQALPEPSCGACPLPPPTACEIASAEAVCAQVDAADKGLSPTEWIFSSLMTEYVSGGEADCTTETLTAACASIAGVSCSSGTCTYPTYDGTDFNAITDMFEDGPPPFLNRRGFNELETALQLQF